MDSEEIRIIPYEGRFEKDIVEVCWQTGFMSQSLEGTGRFNDKYLFGLLWVLQFVKTWPETCWIAVQRKAGKERAVGYLVASVDSARQFREFHRFSTWMWRLLLRGFGYSWWRHPESFRQTLAFSAASSKAIWADPDYREAECPAELHMNLLPAYQGKDLGTGLMQTFIVDFKRRGIPGVHLGTSDRNAAAVAFYKKMGFKLVRESEGETWIGAPARGLDFALKLN